MAEKTVEDDVFIHLFEKLGAAGTSKEIGVAVRNIHVRRRNIEAKYGIVLKSPNAKDNRTRPFGMVELDIEGPVVLFMDAHFWPKIYTDAFWILLQIIHAVKPVAIIDNGDSMDGAKISRHGRIGWDQRPTVQEELQANLDHVCLIEQAAGSDVRLYRNWGNHDLRFDTYLSANAPHIEGVPGTRLQDHFPRWQFQTGLMINDSCIVKHRFKGGVHAGHNNTLWAGLSMVTGHDHILRVTRLSDYRGTRYGVQGGTLADPHGPMFDYTEAAPLNWQMGFTVGYFEESDHRFEAVEVRDGYALFGGRKYRV